LKKLKGWNGYSYEAGSTWTDALESANCNDDRSLYCFEDPQ
jgi:hypothetical protein